MTWNGPTAAWWADEVAADPAYRRDVDPLLRAVIPGSVTGWVVDLGCGDGRLAGLFPRMVGIDTATDLARLAATRMPACVADAAQLPLAGGSVDGAIAVLVLEHLTDPGTLFAEAARVVRRDGFLSVVINHPIYTAPGSGPFLDPDDGEVLWRWGRYLDRGYTDEPAGEGTVRFHHRPLAGLLGSAASEGWALERIEERALEPAGDPLLEAQTQVPRLLGVTWRHSSSTPVRL